METLAGAEMCENICLQSGGENFLNAFVPFFPSMIFFVCLNIFAIEMHFCFFSDEFYLLHAFTNSNTDANAQAQTSL